MTCRRRVLSPRPSPAAQNSLCPISLPVPSRRQGHSRPENAPSGSTELSWQRPQAEEPVGRPCPGNAAGSGACRAPRCPPWPHRQVLLSPPEARAALLPRAATPSTPRSRRAHAGRGLCLSNGLPCLHVVGADVAGLTGHLPFLFLCLFLVPQTLLHHFLGR